MKKIKIKAAFITLLAVCIVSCTKDLNRSPYYGVNSASVYSDPANYLNLLAKLYAGFVSTGQTGPTGTPDINSFSGNEGFTNYIREVWNLEELTTDEAFWTYPDPDIYSLHYMTWTSSNQWATACYDRLLFEVALCNSFISNSSDANLTIHKIGGIDATNIRQYRAEARFLKALALYHALDLFGNIPDITDESKFPGGNFPSQIKRADLFKYIESELLDLQTSMVPPRQNQYGRADQAGAWALLAHLYLNAGVYTGTNRYSDAITYCNKIINAGYILSPSYRYLFLADNNSNAGSKEIIFPIESDGTHEQSFGGTSYLCDAPTCNNLPKVPLWANVKDSLGTDGAYELCLHTTKAFINIFNDQNGNLDSADHRYLFFHQGGLDINIDSFTQKNGDVTQGWVLIKYRNISSTGVPGSNIQFADIDYPMFRLGDIYLIYAEATIQGGGGDMQKAIGYINALRERAYGNSSKDISGGLTLPILQQERGREMEHEGSRRTDLIRWGLYTGGTYIWPWKGGVVGGISVPSYLNLFPIPNSDIVANPNLIQNPGY